jgi:hypothetical protein
VISKTLLPNYQSAGTKRRSTQAAVSIYSDAWDASLKRRFIASGIKYPGKMHHYTQIAVTLQINGVVL